MKVTPEEMAAFVQEVTDALPLAKWTENIVDDASRKQGIEESYTGISGRWRFTVALARIKNEFFVEGAGIASDMMTVIHFMPEQRISALHFAQDQLGKPRRETE